MNESVEGRGRTIDEAVAEALLQLGARKDEVEITVVQEGRSGFLGFLGAKQAVVKVKRKPKRRGQRGGRRRRPLGGRDRDRRDARHGSQRDGEKGSRKGGAAARRDDERPSDDRPAARRADRGQTRGGGDGEKRPDDRRRTSRRQPRRRNDQRKRTGRGPARDAGGDREAATDPRKSPAQDPATRSERGARKQRTEERNRDRANERPAAHVADSSPSRDLEPAQAIGPAVRAAEKMTPLRGIVAEDVPENLQGIATDLMKYSGFPCRVEVKQGDYHLVKVVTDDSSAGVLIGRHGSTVDAIEHLVERMISQAAGERVNMNLDVNNYRLRREETLTERVEEIVDKVINTGREVHMEPLCARERRIVHMAVAGNENLRTYTLSSANGKHVVVAPSQDADPEEEAAAQDSRDEDRGDEGGPGDLPLEETARRTEPEIEDWPGTTTESDPQVRDDESDPPA